MKRLLLVLALFVSPAFATPALVGCTNNTSTGTTTLVITRTTTAGNLLTLLPTEGTNSSTTWTIADTAGNTWSQTAAGYIGDDGSNSRQDIRYVANAASTTSVTITYSGTVSANTAVLCEWSGMVTTSVEDTSVNIQGVGFVTTLTSGTYTTTNSSDVLIYAITTAGAVSAVTAGSGFTIPANGDVGSRHTVQYKIVSATQASQTTSMSWTGSSRASGVFAAFKGAPVPTQASPFVVSP